MHKVTQTKLENLLKIESTIFSDHRGCNFEIYNQQALKKHGIDLNFIQDTYSRSHKNVLRGFHGDYKTWKLVSCLCGELSMVVADFNEDSPTYLVWEEFTLSGSKPEQILVPPGLAIAHLALSKQIVFHYKQTTYYDRKSQFTHAWNDPRLGVTWRTDTPILSERDSEV